MGFACDRVDFFEASGKSKLDVVFPAVVGFGLYQRYPNFCRHTLNEWLNGDGEN